MGQGLYTQIVYGVRDTAPFVTTQDGYTDDAPWFEQAEREAKDRFGVHFDCNYECGPYRGITIAVSDRSLSDYWKVPSFARTVIPGNGLFAWVAENAKDTLERAVKAWDLIISAARKVGVHIPAGELLIVCDWD